MEHSPMSSKMFVINLEGVERNPVNCRYTARGQTLRGLDED